MSSKSSPIFHAMQAALGANQYDTSGGCIDRWNGIEEDGGPVPNYASIDMKKRGYDNFYIHLSQYGEHLATHYNNIVKLNDDKDLEEVYDSLFSFEVSINFGDWFANYVMKHGDVPEKSIALVAMQKLVDEYTSKPAVMVILNSDMVSPSKVH